MLHAYTYYFQGVPPFHLITKRLTRWRGGRILKKLAGNGRYQEIHACMQLGMTSYASESLQVAYSRRLRWPARKIAGLEVAASILAA